MDLQQELKVRAEILRITDELFMLEKMIYEFGERETPLLQEAAFSLADLASSLGIDLEGKSYRG